MGSSEHEEGRKWWERVVDFEEAKRQLKFSIPMILTNLFVYLIPLVSVMFVGHLGDVELAAAALANSWTTVTGVSFMIGLSGALETLCGQSFGAQLFTMLGIHLQSSCIISTFFSTIIALSWWFSEPIFILLHQNPSVSTKAAMYLRYSTPMVFAFGLLQNILRFLQTQNVVLPAVACTAVPLAVDVAAAYVLVHFTELGFRGAPMAASGSMWMAVVMLGLYVKYGKEFERTWTGLSRESFNHVFVNLKLALPSAAIVCLEYWAFETFVLLAGVMPNSETNTSLVAMCVNTETIAYMTAYGFGAATSTRVSNELGDENPGKARHAMVVTLKLNLVVTVFVVIALAAAHSAWAGLFSDNSDIVAMFASMTPLLVLSIVLDAVQGVLSGVIRGCGWQHLAMYTTMASLYIVGMPLSLLLAFKLKLYSKGLWIGVICGLCCQAATSALIVVLRRWAKIEFGGNTSDRNVAMV